MTTHVAMLRPMGAILIALTMAAAVVLTTGSVAGAAVVATIPLGTSANYAVLGASTVTNTGGSTLDGSLGLWPGTEITGFPPGRVTPPGTTDTTNAAAEQAQSDLTVAYLNASGRPTDATTTADLANLRLGAGVYSGPSKSPLELTGPLTLDGGGDRTSVFIFQTDSTLVTGSGSTVTLVNGAQECNVFWQVGSSATLGSGSVFVGNILALTAITVNSNVTVHGRALARNAAVTLQTDTFTRPTCATTTPDGGTGTTPDGGTGTTPDGGTGTTPDGGTGIIPVGTNPGVPAGAVPGVPAGAVPSVPTGTRPSVPRGGPGVPGVVGPPRTGAAPLPDTTLLWLLFAALFGGGAAAGALLTRRVLAEATPAAHAKPLWRQ